MIARNSSFNVTFSTTIESEVTEFRQNGHIGPKLAMLGEVLVSVQPTSVNNERAFSICNLIMTANRLNLDSKKSDTILFLNRNL